MLYIENAKRIETLKKSQKIYIFDCIEKCGYEIRSQKCHLKTHSGKCRSCCQKKRPYEHILSEIKNASKKTKKEFNLSYDEFINIIKIPKCFYCDKLLIFSKYSRVLRTNKYKSKAYQLDRKDNSLGYIKENVVPCCWNCNRIKSDIYSYEDFMKLSPILKQIHTKNG